MNRHHTFATVLIGLVVTATTTSASAQQLRRSETAATVKDAQMLSEQLYAQARSAIENGQFDAALAQLDSLLARFDSDLKDAGTRADAALYWKAYSEAKQRNADEALKTVDKLKEKFKDSSWLKDALALAVEVQQSTGVNVSPNQPDEDLKLLALRGLMRSDPDRAVPMIEQMMAGNASAKVKSNALFVLSQSHSPRAQEIISGVARNSADPELQLKAIRYLGVRRSPEGLKLLDDAFRASSDDRVKRGILRSYMTAGDRGRLLGVANDTNQSVGVRGEAVQQLGVLKADEELVGFYKRETTPRLKARAIDGLFVSRSAVRLVELAKAETNPELKRDIVEKLSLMRSKEATDYMLELLK